MFFDFPYCSLRDTEHHDVYQEHMALRYNQWEIFSHWREELMSNPNICLIWIDWSTIIAGKCNFESTFVLSEFWYGFEEGEEEASQK